MNDKGSETLITRDIYNVTRLNREVRAVLEGSFPLLWVQGEISNLARPASGHIYFSLKDRHSQVRCAMFRNRLRAMQVVPENGMEILARASVSLYEGRGEFQLILEHMEAAGEGALQRAFEELKQRLQKEGLFEESHKQALPAFPASVGVITSPSGAAIRDILQVLRRRYPLAGVIIYPVAVQGDGSAGQIINALQLAEQRRECDVLILARGGGSLEDLWSFNEESVARAIYQCPLPIVSGVGHEIDFTIADFVADHRAPTPSAAAELVSPALPDLQNTLARCQLVLSRTMRRRLERAAQVLGHLQKRLPRPERQLQHISQRLDDGALRMQQAMKSHFAHKRAELLQISAEINRFNPLHLLNSKRQRCRFLQEQLENALQHFMERTGRRLQETVRALHTVSPLATLERGYAIVSHGPDNSIVRDAGDLQEGETINTRLAKGRVAARVSRITREES